MENANWVSFIQAGLVLVGIGLWFLPRKNGGSPLKLPLWQPDWWDGILYLLVGAVGMTFGLGFLLPCMVFFLLREINRSKYEAPLTTRKLSLAAIAQISLRSFLVHWPLLFLVYWVTATLLPDAQPQENVEVLRTGNWETRAKIAFFALVVAPLTEELFFRGILYRTLKSLIDAGPAMLVTSFAFAAAHLNLFAFAPLFALSFFLILVYERTGHLAVPIFYHATFNLLMVIFIVFGKPEI